MVINLTNIKKQKKIKKKSLKIQTITLYFFGPLFQIEKKGRKIYLKLHLSFNMYFEVPEECIIFAFKKRLIFRGDIRIIKNFIKGIINIRNPNIYTGTGLRIRRNTYKTKAGKIRKR